MGPSVQEETAGELLVAHLAVRAAQLRAHGQAVRSGEQGGIHHMRVASRRLRSVLTTCRPLLDREVTDPVCTELRWLGDLLGVARDAQVLRDHLTALVDDEPEALASGAAASRIRAQLSAAHQAAHAAALSAVEDDRYDRLLGTLDDLVAAPPLTDEAESPAQQVMLARIGRDVERLLRAVRAVPSADATGQRDAALHEVRKKAKRVRYAAELARPVLGKQARSLVRSAKRMQRTLGIQHDSVVARQRLWEYGQAVHSAGGSAFTHGRLHAREQARADEAETEFALNWEKVWREQLYRWT